MTALQQHNETSSIETFVDRATRTVREHGTDHGTTCIIMAALRAAADMAPRKADGSIDEEVARVMMRRAARALARLR
jgi:hypothetical protein